MGRLIKRLVKTMMTNKRRGSNNDESLGIRCVWGFGFPLQRTDLFPSVYQIHVLLSERKEQGFFLFTRYIIQAKRSTPPLLARLLNSRAGQLKTAGPHPRGCRFETQENQEIFVSAEKKGNGVRGEDLFAIIIFFQRCNENLPLMSGNCHVSPPHWIVWVVHV
jgi:hypothetical protein